MNTEYLDEIFKVENETRLKIKDAVLLDEPARTKRFKILTEQTTNLSTKNTLELILRRLSILSNHLDGFLPKEHEDFQNRLIRSLHPVLGDEFFIEYLRDQKRILDEDIFESKRMISRKTEGSWDPTLVQEKERFKLNSRLREWLEKVIILFMTRPQEVEEKILLTLENANSLYSILSQYFDPRRHPELLEVLKTGKNVEEKLIFKDVGIRLLDTFKQLKRSDLIIGLKQYQLMAWIVDNFQFSYRGKNTDFKPGTIEQAFSGLNYQSKKPIIMIKDGQILRAL